PVPTPSAAPTPRSTSSPSAPVATARPTGTVAGGVPGSSVAGPSSAATAADLAVSVTEVVLSPDDGAGRRTGSLRVRVDNAGPAIVTGLTVTVRMPDGYRPDGPGQGGCTLTGSAGTYRCGWSGRLVQLASTIFNFPLTAPPGPVRSGPAQQRTVLVGPRVGTDPNWSDNTSAYRITD
ncbi:hypothetical protein ACFQ0D_21965, partial [Micromonospora zhanjiangensis]